MRFFFSYEDVVDVVDDRQVTPARAICRTLHPQSTEATGSRNIRAPYLRASSFSPSSLSSNNSRLDDRSHRHSLIHSTGESKSTWGTTIRPQSGRPRSPSTLALRPPPRHHCTTRHRTRETALPATIYTNQAPEANLSGASPSRHSPASLGVWARRRQLPRHQAPRPLSLSSLLTRTLLALRLREGLQETQCRQITIRGYTQKPVQGERHTTHLPRHRAPSQSTSTSSS